MSTAETRTGTASLTITQGSESWSEAFDKAVDHLKQGRFTSEDVVDMVGLPSGDKGQHRNNAVGAKMRGLHSRKVIRKTGRRVRTTRKTSHSTEITEWTGHTSRILSDVHDQESAEKVTKQRDVALALYEKARRDVLAIHYEAGKTTVDKNMFPTYCFQCKTAFPCKTRKIFL